VCSGLHTSSGFEGVQQQHARRPAGVHPGPGPLGRGPGVYREDSHRSVPSFSTIYSYFYQFMGAEILIAGTRASPRVEMRRLVCRVSGRFSDNFAWKQGATPLTESCGLLINLSNYYSPVVYNNNVVNVRALGCTPSGWLSFTSALEARLTAVLLSTILFCSAIYIVSILFVLWACCAIKLANPCSL